MTCKATKAAKTKAIKENASPMQMPAGESICMSLDISKVPTATMNSSKAAYAQDDAKTQPGNTTTKTKPDIERVNSSFISTN